MEKLFCSSERAEDLLRWSRNLDALGDVISSLTYFSEGDEVFTRAGERLGGIISDYAKAIHGAVTQAYSEINKFFEGDDDVPIHVLKRKLAALQESEGPLHYPFMLERINTAMQTFKPIFDSVMDLNSGFIRLREKAIEDINKARRERALAETDGEAKAHEPDHQRSEAEVNVA